MSNSTSSSFIPPRDAEFNAFANNFAAAVEAKPESYGLTAADAALLKTEIETWDSSYAGMIQKRDQAKSATEAKDAARTKVEALIRTYSKQIQADPDVGNTEKLDAGLPIHSNTRSPKPSPTTAPYAVIESTNVREHTIRMTDPSQPTRRSRPDNVKAIEILCFIGEEHPSNINQFHTIGLSSRMKFTHAFPMDDAGKTVWYLFRYVGTRNEFGPESSQYSAIIPR